MTCSSVAKPMCSYRVKNLVGGNPISPPSPPPGWTLETDGEAAEETGSQGRPLLPWLGFRSASLDLRDRPTSLPPADKQRKPRILLLYFPKNHRSSFPMWQTRCKQPFLTRGSGICSLGCYCPPLFLTSFRALRRLACLSLTGRRDWLAKLQSRSGEV